MRLETIISIFINCPFCCIDRFKSVSPSLPHSKIKLDKKKLKIKYPCAPVPGSSPAPPSPSAVRVLSSPRSSTAHGHHRAHAAPRRRIAVNEGMMMTSRGSRVPSMVLIAPFPDWFVSDRQRGIKMSLPLFLDLYGIVQPSLIFFNMAYLLR